MKQKQRNCFYKEIVRNEKRNDEQKRFKHRNQQYMIQNAITGCRKLNVMKKVKQ